MKSVLTGICIMIVISALAWIVTDTQVATTGEAHKSANNSVRLDD